MSLLSRRTNLLALLVVVAGVCAVVAFFHLQDARAAALASENELVKGRAALEELTSGNSGQRIATATPSEQQLDQLINAAATESNTKISSIEPGPADPQASSGYVETAVFLRLDALSMRQLVTFLHALSQRDAAVRAKSIELSPPAAQAAEATAPDAWAADVTIGYKSFAGAKAK